MPEVQQVLDGKRTASIPMVTNVPMPTAKRMKQMPAVQIPEDESTGKRSKCTDAGGLENGTEFRTNGVGCSRFHSKLHK